MSLEQIRADTVRARGFAKSMVTMLDKVVAQIDVELAPPPATDRPTFNPVTDVQAFKVNSADPFYASMGAAGAPGPGPRLAPYPSPAVNGQPMIPGECSIVTEGARKFLRCFYATKNAQQGPAWWVVGHKAANVPATAEHCWGGIFRVHGEIAGQEIAVKFMRMWLRQTPTQPVPFVQWSTHNHLPYPGSIENQPTLFQLYSGAGDEAEPYPIGHDQGTQPHGPYLANLVGGEHELLWGFKPHSAVDVLDGFARFWIDGQKVLDVSAATARVTPPGGAKQWCGPWILESLPVAAQIDAVYGPAIGGTMSTLSKPPWALEFDVDSFLWWVRPAA